MRASDAQDRLRDLALAGNAVFSIHYSCESWYTVKDRPVAVSCISIVRLSDGSQTTLSQIDVPSNSDDATAQEKGVLRRYFDFLDSEQDARFVHWNMTSSDFGFRALETRFSYLNKTEAPRVQPLDRTYDLDELVAALYGREYAEHPRLVSLAKLNSFPVRYALSGKDEAEKFGRNEHGEIKRSTAEKARMIAELSGALRSGTLETRKGGRRVQFAAAMVDVIELLLTIGRRFTLVATELKRRHANRATLVVSDEHDVQDAFRSVVRLFVDDVRPEEWTPGYAGGSARIDFVLPLYRVAIELKHSRPTLTARELGDQLIVDVARYKGHPHVRHLVCLIFDLPRHIENPRGVEADLSGEQEGITITVLIIDS